MEAFLPYGSYAYGAIDSGLLSMVSRITHLLPPRREDECIDC
jgi:hypothetical protein